jgi:RNA polymerase sigma-70 factor, ECF subfamily
LANLGLNQMKQATDETLMQLLGKGNKAAFEILYERYFDKLTWFAQQYTHDLHSAEDMVQDVFIKLIEHPERFDANKKFSTWVYSITGNRCKNLLRDTENRSHLLNSQSQANQTESHSLHDLELIKKEIRNEFKGMNEKEKSLFVLRFEHELPIKEIAEITQLPEGSVKSGIYYLLKKLAKNLNRFTHEY